MASYTLVPLPRIGITPEGGMLINTYLAGTSTPSATYTDSTGSTSNSNPVQADGLGLFPAIYIPTGTNYKFLCTHAVTNGVQPNPVTNIGALIWSQDGIGLPGSNAQLDIIGTAGVNIAAGQPAYISAGDGALNPSQWYLTDSANAYSSSDAVLVGLAVTAISSGMSGAFRTEGQYTTTSSLSPGSRYYVGTVGTLTTTQPSKSRLVGIADGVNSILITQTQSSGLDFLQIEAFL